jgi:hypothetical protein
MMGRNNNNKKMLVALTGAAAISLLVSSIAVIGPAQLSYQQSIIGGGFIGRGVITSSLIADNTIVSADLRDGAAVRSSDIVDGQVNTADLADDAVTSDKIKNGEVKAEDLDPSIELGDGSGAIQLNVHRVDSDRITIPGNLNGGARVDCPPGETLIGGGFDVTPSVRVTTNYPEDENTWFVAGQNLVSGSQRLSAFALCAVLSS